MEKGRHKQRKSRVLFRLHGQATVVFDDYEEGPFIKDITHKSRGQKREPEYEFQRRAE
ncbi:hypothetical protein DPMN_160431 [Dreissena polymorpha]|uniref:Uncharacterized protein n=1 Tax=Dreissena polymorpha TaxID=45954 RepID=A0A9D4EKS3_DREPO|nr:hypothetical protein DPMN_160431 [Dreissena polymorpha]